MEANRAERRRRAADAKCQRADEERAAAANGVAIEALDFQRLLARSRAANGLSGVSAPWSASARVWSTAAAEAANIRVCVRKRPMLQLERTTRDLDVVDVPPGAQGCAAEQVVVHEPRSKVDLTKAIDSHRFHFDGVFGEHDGNECIHSAAVLPMLDHVARGGTATVFAFGQTGSGKTHTMAGHGSPGHDGDGERHTPGLYALAAADIMRIAASRGARALVSFYEIYGGQVLDLLSERTRRSLLEDAEGRMVVVGLAEMEVSTADELLDAVRGGQRLRAVGATAANATSSRSHAILTVALRCSAGGACAGRLNLVDLAGSERASDSTSKDRKTRAEGAEINKSLLCLKECIRSLDTGHGHVPFRGSKLTQVLRDSFVGSAKTLMIAMVAPGAAAAEHTLNTLRYAQRVRDFSSRGAPLHPKQTPGQRPPAPALKRNVAARSPPASAPNPPAPNLLDEMGTEDRPCSNRGLESRTAAAAGAQRGRPTPRLVANGQPARPVLQETKVCW